MNPKDFDISPLHSITSEDYEDELLPGFRIQLHAVSEEAKALTCEDSLNIPPQHEIHSFYEGAVWKVRVGDFLDANSAEELRLELQSDGFPDAYVVESPVCPRISGFRVQVGSLKSRASAVVQARNLDPAIEAEIHIVRTGGYWKIRIGDFNDKEQAQALCEKLKSMGYEESWVVSDKVKL